MPRIETTRRIGKRGALVGVVAGSAIALASGGNARAAEAAITDAPVRVFAQAGVGVLEIGHIEAGVFVTPHLAVEGMAAWDGVFGGHYGGGVFGLFGHTEGARPPRHGLLVGARVMLDENAAFDSHGDELTSYGVLPIGYSFLAANGFFLRATAGPAFTRERKDSGPPTTGVAPWHHTLGVGAMFNASAGFAF